MAKVQGVKEKLQFLLWDCFFVSDKDATKKVFQDFMTDPRVIRYFIDVQSKTKLETNMQAAGVLPSLNTYEARAMRVVASTFCIPGKAFYTPTVRKTFVQAGEAYRTAEYSETAKNALVDSVVSVARAITGTAFISSQIREDIINAADNYKKEFELCVDWSTGAGTKKDSSSLSTNPALIPELKDRFVAAIISSFEKRCASVNTALAELIYNSVITLLVGEKTMFEAPTFWFPSGAGVFPGFPTVSNHGEPDPTATFRFAEPVFIEPQQNFRVEMMFPQGLPPTLQNLEGPLRIWVVLDGYLTRDVQ